MHRAILLALVAALGMAQPARAEFQSLLSAARLGDLQMVRDLLAAGDDPNPPDFHRSYAPLQFAAGNGHAEMTMLLLAAGADTEYRDHNGDRALLWAAQRGHDETVRLLLAAGSPPDSDDPYGSTPMMPAAWYGHVEVVRLLLAAGADVHRFDQSGGTALHLAARSGKPELVAMLLDAGANPNVLGSILYETPLHEAAARGSAEAIGLLIAAGAGYDPRDRDGATPLLLAARRGHPGVVAALLQTSADPDAMDFIGTSPMSAAMSGPGERDAERDKAALLLADRTDRIDKTFALALWRNYPAVARHLLARGASVDAVGESGSALAGSAQLPEPDLMRELLARGADLAKFGGEALVAAGSAGRVEAIEILLGRGVPVDARHQDGPTALLAAAGAGQVPAVRLLLDAGADPAARDGSGSGIDTYLAARPAFIALELDRYAQSAALHPEMFDLEDELAALEGAHAEIRVLLGR